MRLRLSTDYAIRLLVALSKAACTLTAYELAEKVHVPKPSVIKIMVRLKSVGWISSQDGILGGYIMATELSNISLLNVLKVMDDDFQLAIFQDDNLCRWNDGIFSCASDVYMHLQLIFEKVLNGITLDNIADNNIDPLKELYKNLS